MEEKKKIGKLRKLYRAYLTDDIKRDMYVNGADEKLIDLVEAEEVEEEDLYKFLNQLSVLKKFIKWLVENDKIDLSKLYHDMRLEFGDYYWLLMQLSISDTPIDFLCDIIKN